MTPNLSILWKHLSMRVNSLFKPSHWLVNFCLFSHSSHFLSQFVTDFLGLVAKSFNTIGVNLVATRRALDVLIIVDSSLKPGILPVCTIIFIEILRPLWFLSLSGDPLTVSWWSVSYEFFFVNIPIAISMGSMAGSPPPGVTILGLPVRWQLKLRGFCEGNHVEQNQYC